MKAKLEFDLDDYSDREKFDLYTQSMNMYFAVDDFIFVEAKKVLKYEEGHSDEYLKGYEKAKHDLLSLLDERDVKIGILS